MTKTYKLSNEKTVKVTAKNKRKSSKWGGEHYAYTITMEVDDKMFKTTFHDSIYNYSRGTGATKEMIDNAVYCIIMDSDSYKYNQNLQDFVSEYGYDPEEPTGVSVFQACREVYEAISQMFTEAELEELYNLVDGDTK